MGSDEDFNVADFFFSIFLLLHSLFISLCSVSYLVYINLEATVFSIANYCFSPPFKTYAKIRVALNEAFMLYLVITMFINYYVMFSIQNYLIRLENGTTCHP